MHFNEKALICIIEPVKCVLQPLSCAENGSDILLCLVSLVAATSANSVEDLVGIVAVMQMQLCSY